MLEKGLEEQVEIVVAHIRLANSPYYSINPSGRVPYLVCDDGTRLEESYVICTYLDHLDGNPAFDLPAGDKVWEACRLEALARSLLDGFAVWGREARRPKSEQSPRILLHEADRSKRMVDLWESEIDHQMFGGKLNMAQITLASALGFAALIADLEWRPEHPKLCAWFDKIATRPSLQATAPPSVHDQ